MFWFKINHPLFFLPVTRLKHCNMGEKILEMLLIFTLCPSLEAEMDTHKPDQGNTLILRISMKALT